MIDEIAEMEEEDEEEEGMTAEQKGRLRCNGLRVLRPS